MEVTSEMIGAATALAETNDPTQYTGGGPECCPWCGGEQAYGGEVGHAYDCAWAAFKRAWSGSAELVPLPE